MPAAANLAVLEKAHNLVLTIYRLTSSFPDDERFGLSIQLRRAAVSVPSNLVEGRARASEAEFRRHVDIAHGSIAEVEYQLRLARDLGYMLMEEWRRADDAAQEVSRMLAALKRNLSESLAHSAKDRGTRRNPVARSS
jgi:four helix bundle protein